MAGFILISPRRRGGGVKPSRRGCAIAERRPAIEIRSAPRPPLFNGGLDRGQDAGKIVDNQDEPAMDRRQILPLPIGVMGRRNLPWYCQPSTSIAILATRAMSMRNLRSGTASPNSRRASG